MEKISPSVVNKATDFSATHSRSCCSEKDGRKVVKKKEFPRKNKNKNVSSLQTLSN